MENPTLEGESDSKPADIPAALSHHPLRVWPAVFLIILMVAARYGPGLFEGAAQYWMISVFGPLLCCLLLLIWWLAASRATWRERVLGLVGLIAAVVITLVLEHPSMRGPGTTYFTLPMGFFVFGATAALLKRFPPFLRTTGAVLLAFAGFGVSMLLRSDGMTGDYTFSLHPRWQQTPEELMLTKDKAPSSSPVSQLQTNLAKAEWPAFRGADRASRSMAPKITTDWTAHPPQQLWKIQVGPGWSSFAVAGKRLFTQEQRGAKEGVVCFDADSGAELWRTESEARLEDPMGGPGPRATPTVADGDLYALGGTGIFQRLDATTGLVIWKKDLTEVAGRKTPMWGFSSSPLVVSNRVIVYAGGPGDKGLLAFDADSGDLRWSAAAGSDSYASPQLNAILGDDLVAMLSNDGLVLVDPLAGQVKLNYEWKFSQYRALQPHVVGSDTVLLPTGMNMGTRAIQIRRTNGQFSAEELWTSRQLKPDFVDLVSYDGYVYGNDNGILTCIDLKTGERKWKGGRYGKGQLLLLENSRALLVAAEQGQVVLIALDPGEHRELASFKALEGKTWNHPVVVGDRLYLRNSQEAAAYRLPLEPTNSLAKLSVGSRPILAF